VLGPRERVPHFRVTSVDGRVFDSDALVGKEPFVLVFFASWCRVCDMKLPMVSEVFRQGTPVAGLGVALDEPETWHNVPAFVDKHQLGLPIVRAQSFPRFTLAYDPFQTVPVVAIVGRNGYLVDYQIGYASTHRARLAAALDLARRMPADAPPFLDSLDPDAEDAR
jgi:thiol-disulfide isomerase/thioredoxin